MAVRKTQPKAAPVDTKARLRAIRKLASPVPDRTATDRLRRIEGIASGSITPEMGRLTTSPDLLERLAAGQASRSPRVGDKKREPKEREKRGGRNRMESGGADREE